MIEQAKKQPQISFIGDTRTSLKNLLNMKQDRSLFVKERLRTIIFLKAIKRTQTERVINWWDGSRIAPRSMPINFHII